MTNLNYELVCEDQLPEMTEDQYSIWFKKSLVVNGVRMGNPIIYIDTPIDYGHNSREKFSHMTCKDISYLHAFAKMIGIKRCWYENKRADNRPHYDVKESYFKAAIAGGAIHLNRRQWMKKTQELFGDIPCSRSQTNLNL